MLSEDCKLSVLGIEHCVQPGTASMLCMGRLCQAAHKYARHEARQKADTLCKTQAMLACKACFRMQHTSTIPCNARQASLLQTYRMDQQANMP